MNLDESGFVKLHYSYNFSVGLNFSKYKFGGGKLGCREIKMQAKKKGKKNLRAFVLIVNLSSCHSDCHRAIASMLVNAEKLYST